MTVGAPESQRSRILAAALTLVSELGAAGTSMRRLASACGLNVATIYHYFPSKADLVRALVEEQRYGERMAADDPPLAAERPAGERFAAFFLWVVAETLEEETVLRLLVGEGMHGDAVAREAARDLLAALDVTLAAWLASGFPELAPSTSPVVAARLVRRTLLAVVTEHLATGHDDRAAAAEDLATTLFPTTA
ncbi:MAG TPA: helix-turn-helix domain-containing protein [Acidimicrobiales bacterium]|nr:helix-turn-helix domain-containing protein [Acidimicrobiales bacterium]